MPEPLRIVALAARGLLPRDASLWFSRQYERGVTERLVIDAFGRTWFSQTFGLETGLSLSGLGDPFPQFNLQMISLNGIANFPNAHSFFVLGWANERWPAWNVHENRVIGYWLFSPLKVLSITFGLAFRSPVFPAGGPGTNDELSILYSLDWEFFQLGSFNAGLTVGNYSRMRVYTPDNGHFTSRLRWLFGSSGLQLHAFATAGVKGVSGGILSFGQNQIGGGIGYGF